MVMLRGSSLGSWKWIKLSSFICVKLTPCRLTSQKKKLGPWKAQRNWLWPSAYTIETQTSASLESHPANTQKRGWCLLNHEHRCGKSCRFLPHCSTVMATLVPTIISDQMSSTYVYSQKGWAGRFGVQWSFATWYYCCILVSEPSERPFSPNHAFLIPHSLHSGQEWHPALLECCALPKRW